MPPQWKEDSTYAYLMLQLGRVYMLGGWDQLTKNIYRKCGAENFKVGFAENAERKIFKVGFAENAERKIFKVGFAENAERKIFKVGFANFSKIKKMKNLKIFFGNKNMTLGCFGEEMNKRWKFMTTEEIEEDFRETMKGWSKCNQEMKRNRRFPRLVIEHLQTGKEWVMNKEEAESFVGRTLKGVGDYYIVEGEEYIMYELE